MGKFCIDCGVEKTSNNTYKKGRKLQSRCKICQIKKQAGYREVQRSKKGLTMTETKISGKGNIRLKYNPRRQIVDIRGPLKAKESGFFFVEIFDDKHWTYLEDEKEFCYRVVHVSRILWEEVTIDYQSVEEYMEDKKRAKENEDDVHSRKLARRRNRG